jgi:cytochrome c peroxidase
MILQMYGRAASLEDQALGPIQSPVEMNQNLEELNVDAILGDRDASKSVGCFDATAKAAWRNFAVSINCSRFDANTGRLDY